MLILALFAQSTGMGYASQSLRPISSRNNGLAIGGKENLSPFLEQFHDKHTFINTSDIGMAEEEKISIREMLIRYAAAHPDRLEDPESVLVLVCENDGKVILKHMFADISKHVVSKGEYYWVTFAYPSFNMPDESTPDEELFPKSGDMTPKDMGRMKTWLEDVAGYLVSGRGPVKGLLESTSGSMSGHATDENSDNAADGDSPELKLAKRLMLYYVKSSDDIGSHSDKKAIFHLMERLIKHKDVEAWAVEVLGVLYSRGHYKDKDRSFSIGIHIREEFELLLTILLGRIDFLNEKTRQDILSIAVDLFIQMFKSRFDLDDSNEFVKAMTSIDDPQIKKAVFLKILFSLEYNAADIYSKESKYKELIKFFKPHQRPWLCQFLVYEFLKYLLYVSPYDEVKYSSGRNGSLMKQIGIMINIFGEEAILQMMDLLVRESDTELQDKIFLFIEEHSWSHKAYRFDGMPKRWIDILIYLGKSRRLHLVSVRWTKWDILSKYPDYRRQEMEELLVEMLKDPSRDDINSILVLLEKYRSSKAHDAVLSAYLKAGSSSLEAAIGYITTLADPEYFDRVCDSIESLLSSEEKLSKYKMTDLSDYFVSVLIYARDRLSPAQISRIEGFAQKHIFSRSLEDILGDEDKYSSKEQIAQNWILLAGLLNREDKFEKIKGMAESLLTEAKGLDSGLQTQLSEPILQALLYYTSDESYEFLARSCLKLMGFGRGALYNFLRKGLNSVNIVRKRRLFAELLDMAVENQLRQPFNEIAHIFIFLDTEYALVQMKERWDDVDLSEVELYASMPMDEIFHRPDTKLTFLPKEARDYFLEWYLRHITSPESLDNLKLFDDNSEFYERIRKAMRIILLEDLELESEDVKERFEGLLMSFFELLMWDENAEEEQQFKALYMVKTVVDICKIDIDGPGGWWSSSNFRKFIMERLKKQDPAFYIPHEKQAELYVAWLIRNKAVKRTDLYMTLDRFAALFINANTTDKITEVMKDYRTHGLKIKNLIQLKDFMSKQLMPVFFPADFKMSRFPSISFERVFLRVLATLWVKDVADRVSRGKKVQLSIPMFKVDPEKVLPHLRKKAKAPLILPQAEHKISDAIASAA